MLLERTNQHLQAFGARLFALVEELSGTRPKPIDSGNWYRAEVAGRPFVYIRFVGERAQKHPQNSVLLTAPWSEAVAGAGSRDREQLVR